MAQQRILVILASLPWACRALNVVRPNTHWKDTDGNRIEAHAAGMLQSPVDGRWYWYGESAKTDRLADHGVNCYSAETIAGPWKNEGPVLHQSNITEPSSVGPFVVERPKVLYNTATNKFVMWFHLDDAGYKYRHVGVAQADHATGPFEYVHGMQPDGVNSLDMSLFRDPVDHQAYFIRSCDNEHVAISRLSPDYLTSTGIISTHNAFEGMAIFRHPNGTYYMMASHLTGWDPNPLMLFRAEGETLDDPRWVDMGNPTGQTRSFNSQPTYVVQYTPKSGDPYFVYMGDNWLHCPNEDGSEGPLINACYIWLPIRFHNDLVTVQYAAAWDLEDPFASGSPPPAVTCEASASNAAGQAVALATCEDGLQSQKWSLGSTFSQSINLAGLNSLCMDLRGGVASLQPCRGTIDQTFSYSEWGWHLRWSSNGKCLDVPWWSCPECNAKIGTYSCNTDHPNQFFEFDVGSGHLISRASGESLCVTACDMANGTCELSARAVIGQSLVLMQCQDQLVSQKWDVRSRRSNSNSVAMDNLCLDVDNANSVSLQTCSDVDSQSFKFIKPIRQMEDGTCLDLMQCGNRFCDGMRLESKRCSMDRTSQFFNYDLETGHLISQASVTDLCVTTCNTPSDVLIV